jgi:cytochrome P450
LLIAHIVQDLGRKVSEIRNGINDAHKQVKHPTIFHELLNSNLPENEKTDARLGDEAQLIIAAGIITTSWVLSVGSFHIINNPKIQQRLRDEIKSAEAGQKEPLNWHQLEKLPYLNGCLHESVRLAHGIVTRQPRLAPDEELQYGSWSIPRNTPVSMTSVHTLMNEDIFPNPKEFQPERWINRPDLDRYFVPFGKGSRGCLGIKYEHWLPLNVFFYIFLYVG